jgi:hypothetical protein
MVVHRLFVLIDQTQISILEMENILLLFHTRKKKKEIDLAFLVSDVFTSVIPSDQTSDRTS